MTAIIVAAVVVIVIGGALAIVLSRYVARREMAPVLVLVSGEVPPAPEWMQPALRARALTPTDGWRWSPVENAGVLTGFRGDVRMPNQKVVLTATLQPHTHPTTFSSSRPLRVLVDLTEYARRTGPQRLVFGAYADKTSLVLRTALQRSIRDQARAAGTSAKVPGRLRATTVAAAAAVVLILVLVAVVGTQLVAMSGLPKPAPTTRPAAPPASATKCPASGDVSKPPKRSASGNKATGCPLAESARQAYIKRAAKGKPVTLAKVARPKSKQKYDLACKGASLVTCSGGGILVYLY